VADPANPFFGPAQVNRIWLHLFGRGLVDPNDDFRATNPPTNPELLTHLVQEFRRGGSRVKPLVRHILLSRTYQLSAGPSPEPELAERHFAQALVQPLEAEQLLDALGGTLGIRPKFAGYPRGVRAGALPALPLSARRSNASERFMRMFGKPDRNLTCECERSEDAGLIQAFQLMTGPLVQQMLRDPKNRLNFDRPSDPREPREQLDRLYLSALSRFPSEAERQVFLPPLTSSKEPRPLWEDIAWAIVNSKEFQLRR
ncbi:MAG: DUF1553 domain-containing protein, partial [Gemmataceae bacterium]